MHALAEPKYLDAAKKSAEFVLSHQKTADGRLLRTYGGIPGQAAKAAGSGYLEDYAFLVHGLLNLHEATKDKRWLDESASLTDTMIKRYGDERRGGYFMTANDSEKLFARAKDQYDGPQPSGNSAAVRNLVRLWGATGDEKWKKEADRGFRYFAGSLMSYGPGMVTLAEALDRYLEIRDAKEVDGTKLKDRSDVSQSSRAMAADRWGHDRPSRIFDSDRRRGVGRRRFVDHGPSRERDVHTSLSPSGFGTVVTSPAEAAGTGSRRGSSAYRSAA